MIINEKEYETVDTIGFKKLKRYGIKKKMKNLILELEAIENMPDNKYGKYV